ncbi:hypothetical protein BH11ARM2_BH11ARM2_24690 [soil metagenome]
MRLRIALAIPGILLAGWASAQNLAANPKSVAIDPRVEALPQVVVRLNEGVSPQLFAARRGLTLVRPFVSRSDTWVMAARSVAEAASAATQNDGDVAQVYQDYRLPIALRWVPNDPLYAPGTPAGATGQWHLRNVNNVGGASIDARVWEAWQRDWTGQGVTIGICDDSLEKDHPDLAPNFDAADSYDFGQGDTDPSPASDSDQHGISVSGVAAARGGNGIGVTGAAPFAQLAGLRLPFSGGGSASAFEDAIRYHSIGSTPKIQLKNHSYGATLPYLSDQPEVAALQDSIAAGTIHVWAAGNDRKSSGNGLGQNEDANKAATQAVPGEIVVAALGSNGVYASYSSYGANITVTAPSSSSIGITTTDRTGAKGYNGLVGYADYTNQFGGTSSAAPLVTGVLALVKQAQPVLDGRFAKHLLALSSDKVDPKDATESSDGGWRTNGAGIAFNQDYGFGLVNADRLTTNALLYTGVTPLETTDSGTVNVSAAIPDNSTTGVSRTFTVSKTAPMEEAIVTVNLTHTHQGDIQVYLTSPSGYRSRLLVRNASDTSSMSRSSWTAVSNAFWGENPKGTWKITVTDGYAGSFGTFNSFRVQTRNGSLKVKPLEDHAEFVSQVDVPKTLAPGQAFRPTVTFKNAGTSAWTKEGGYLVQFVKPVGGTTWGIASQKVKTTVATGTNGVFKLVLTAPTTPGTYNFSWQMGSPNGLFGAASPRVKITVQ